MKAEKNALADRLSRAGDPARIAEKLAEKRELFDRVWLVDAPLESRLVRNPKASQRDRLQTFDRSEADIVIINDDLDKCLDEAYSIVSDFLEE